MEIKTFQELQNPDEMSLHFTPWGLGGRMRPEQAARFQQEAVAACDLVPEVAETTRAAFDRLRRVYAYGVLSYDVYTLVHDQAHLIRERALRDRFMQWCGGSVTFEDITNSSPLRTEQVSSYDEVFSLVQSRSRRSRPDGPVWRLQVDGKPMKFNGMLAGLNAWARCAGLLRGQRARHVEKIWCDLRNIVAHGDSGIEMPVEAARTLRNLAEFINQLWGAPTVGGRDYPAALPRQVVGLSWNSRGGRCAWPLDTLRNPDEVEDMNDTFLLVRAVAEHGTRLSDADLLEFDARFETTRYPADYLWGPGSRAEAVQWLDANEPEGDTVDHIDRVLLVREHAGNVYLPMRPEAAAGIGAEHHEGRWHTVLADFPNDALAHARNAQADPDGHGKPGADCPSKGCSVHVLSTGSYQEALAAAALAEGPVKPVLHPRTGMPPRIELPNRF